MSDYVVARLQAGFSVTKFEDDAEPAAEYRVTQTAKGWKCDCPAFMYQRKGTCKHITMVQEKLIKESDHD